MKQYRLLIVVSLFLFSGSFFAFPTHAQILDIPVIPNEEEKASFSFLKSEHEKLTALLPRLESTITLLTKRGFDTTEAFKKLEETKIALIETNELFEKKNTRRAVLKEENKKNRELLIITIKEIRISLTTLRN